MGLTSANIAALELENVQELIPELLKSEVTLDSLIQDNGRAQRVGTIAYRIPLKFARPGDYKSGSLDGATLPIGAGPQWDKGSITPQVLMLPVGWTKLVELVGVKADKVAIANVVDETMADAVEQLRNVRDVLLQTDGTGKLGVVSGIAANVVTMQSGAGAGFGARLLFPGQTVGLWNGNTLVGLYPSTISSVFNTLGGTQSFAFTGSDPGTSNGFFIRCNGLTTGAPVFVNGIRAFINSSTAGSYLGITKSAAPYVVSNQYDLGGGQITLPAARLIINMVQSRLGKKGLKGQIWHTHPSQVAAYEELGFERQELTSDGVYKEMDLMFEDFRVAGYPIHSNNNADQTIWDFLQIKTFGKVMYGDGPFWFEASNGKIYPIYDTTTGAPTTQFGATMIDASNYYNDNPLANGSITSARVPTGN